MFSNSGNDLLCFYSAAKILDTIHILGCEKFLTLKIFGIYIQYEMSENINVQHFWLLMLLSFGKVNHQIIDWNCRMGWPTPKC